MASRTIVLAHGAGAGMDSPFMNSIASGLVERGERVARFEFPYMNERRIDGGRRPPNASAILMDCWREAIKLLGPADRLVIGGKSLGGRIASMVADDKNLNNKRIAIIQSIKGDVRIYAKNKLKLNYSGELISSIVPSELPKNFQTQQIPQNDKKNSYKLANSNMSNKHIKNTNYKEI